MSDPASTARSARESLSRGLQALQADPTVPQQLLELAAPIAQSMGALHQIERSNGAQLAPHAGVALENMRRVLSALQAQTAPHPAVNVATEAVASSLGLVHALHKLSGSPVLETAAPVAAAPAPAPQPAPQQAHFPQPAPPQAAPHSPLAATAFGAPTAPQPAPAPVPQQVHFAPPQPAAVPQPQPQRMEFAPAAAAPQPQQANFPPLAQAAPPPAPTDAPVVTADLGAQSATNFYKGLSGNDIIDHGGLFVSTYMIPKIGTPIRLKVSLPGGYEFEANAVVRWAREQSDGSDAPPGFGAQFTQITQEARQLVYRYVRNREPLFHDDL